MLVWEAVDMRLDSIPADHLLKRTHWCTGQRCWAACSRVQGLHQFADWLPAGAGLDDAYVHKGAFCNKILAEQRCQSKLYCQASAQMSTCWLAGAGLDDAHVL